MKRRLLLALPLLPLARPAAAQGIALTARDRADIARIEAYLGTLRSLKGRFLQVSTNGSTSQGNAWLQRPGRMRFEYDPPAPFLLVAGYGIVMFYDRKLQQVSSFPIGQTPLGLLLADKVSFSGDATVTGIARQPGMIQITFVKTGAAGDGSLTLAFADEPLLLRQWTVVDAQRQETRVSLFNLQFGDTFDQKLFDVTDPRQRGGGNQ